MRLLTLRTRVVVLVLAAVLPLIGLNLAGIHWAFRAERAHAGRQALDLARGLSFAIEGELRARIAALEVLALSPALRQGDLAGFRRDAEAVVARQLPGANILLLRPDGQQLMNTAAPPDARLPVREYLANHRRVLDSGRPSVSDSFFGIVVRRRVVAIDVPVLDAEGRVTAVLGLNPTIAAFERLISRQWPGGGWVVTLLDRAGTRIARQPPLAEPPDPAPGAAPDALPPREALPGWDGQAEGVVATAGPDGAPMLAAYVRSDEFGWGVAVAVPLAELSRPAWRSALLSLAGGLALLLIGLLLAHRVSRGITRPIAALRRLAAAPEGQAGAAEIATGLPETDEVAKALRAEALRRGAAIQGLQESERRLRLVVAELNHRAKNALATVQALALQTARGEAGSDPARFAAEFGARLQTLARAHDLLTALSWEPAALEAVLRAGLAPWLETGDGEPPRIRLHRLDGAPPPLASPGQAQAIVLALHELATNATKYGALSRPEGRVEVTCQGEAEGQVGVIAWRELDGPPVPGPPPRRGFGTRLLERVLVRDLGPGARVELDFAAEGVRATIRFAPRPAPAVMAEAA